MVMTFGLRDHPAEESQSISKIQKSYLMRRESQIYKVYSKSICFASNRIAIPVKVLSFLVKREMFCEKALLSCSHRGST